MMKFFYILGIDIHSSFFSEDIIPLNHHFRYHVSAVATTSKEYRRRRFPDIALHQQDLTRYGDVVGHEISESEALKILARIACCN
jgi:hypothetical protein